MDLNVCHSLYPPSAGTWASVFRAIRIVKQNPKNANGPEGAVVHRFGTKSYFSVPIFWRVSLRDRSRT